MNLIKIVTIAQVASAVLLIISILMQQRGSGLSGTFGGDGSGMYSTRRGIERALFIATIVFAIIFIGVSAYRILL